MVNHRGDRPRFSAARERTREQGYSRGHKKKRYRTQPQTKTARFLCKDPYFDDEIRFQDTDTPFKLEARIREALKITVPVRLELIKEWNGRQLKSPKYHTLKETTYRIVFRQPLRPQPAVHRSTPGLLQDVRRHWGLNEDSAILPEAITPRLCFLDGLMVQFDTDPSEYTSLLRPEEWWVRICHGLAKYAEFSRGDYECAISILVGCVNHRHAHHSARDSALEVRFVDIRKAIRIYNEETDKARNLNKIDVGALLDAMDKEFNEDIKQEPDMDEPAGASSRPTVAPTFDLPVRIKVENED